MNIKSNMLDTQEIYLADHSHSIAAKLSFRESLKKIASKKQVTLIDEDDSSLAAFVTGILVERIIIQCQWHAETLSKKQQHAVWFVLQEISERLCRHLDTSPDIVSTYTAMWIFRHAPDYLFGTILKRVKSQSIRRESDAQTDLYFTLLTRRIDKWLFDRDLSKTDKIARIVGMMSGDSVSILENWSISSNEDLLAKGQANSTPLSRTII